MLAVACGPQLQAERRQMESYGEAISCVHTVGIVCFERENGATCLGLWARKRAVVLVLFGGRHGLVWVTEDTLNMPQTHKSVQARAVI